jgi:three-Cys-motif partner protein
MPKRKEKEFFDEMTDQSEIKTELVRKYLWAWAKVISNQVKKMGGNKIAFVDLFAGPGRYNDGTPSTPIKILEGAIRDKQIVQMLAAYFNDADSNNVIALEEEIKKVAGITLLKFQPVVRNYEVNDDLAGKFESWSIPTLFFLDPFGYKGLTRRLIRATLKPWGSDCIFFFNYNRINAGLSNPKFTENMNSFFGEERAERLRASLEGRAPAERQALVIEALKEVVGELGGEYNIEYFFKDDSGFKTSHFLIFASKNVLGYDLMKSIMAKESSSTNHGVASFGFNPLDQEKALEKETKPTLFDMHRDPVDDLASDLLKEYAGQIMTVREIYYAHHIGKPFTLRNYQEALKKLDSGGRIQTNPPAKQRMRTGQVTLGESVVITFPKKEAD